MSSMEEQPKSKFADLYKSHRSEDERQENRRRLLLKEQKRQRANVQDDVRGLEEFVSKLKRSNNYRHKSYKQKYDENHKLQLSEWLREKPEDFNRWLLVPCPKGQRCLVIATGGTTEMYSKTGHFLRSFHTDLPGDSTSRHQVSILDCIYAESVKTFYVLDLIAYGNHEMVNCETEFRFFWIKSKILEELFTQGDYKFIPLTFYDLGDDYATASCLQRYPQWDENSPELDGLLFYHKEASYTYGTTPLVGWLFPFMVPEILGIAVNSGYLKDKPEDYVDYLHFMTLFDEELLKKKSKFLKSRRRSGKMDEDPCDLAESAVDDILDDERKLELEGNCEMDNC